MKKYAIYLIAILTASVLMSYAFINQSERRSPLAEILNKTPKSKLPMSVILYNMDVENWSEATAKSAKFTHKYKIITNANSPRKMEVTITDFLPVSQDEFIKYYNNLDMEIAAKYIDEDDEIETEDVAAPPAYAKYVGKKKYGRWITDRKTGVNTWRFRRRYRNLVSACGLNDFKITSKDFNDYRNNYYGKRAYFGRTGEKPLFGTGSEFSRNSRRTSIFYDDDRETRVRNFYKNYQLRIGRNGTNIRSRSGNSGK